MKPRKKSLESDLPSAEAPPPAGEKVSWITDTRTARDETAFRHALATCLVPFHSPAMSHDIHPHPTLLMCHNVIPPVHTIHHRTTFLAHQCHARCLQTYFSEP